MSDVLAVPATMHPAGTTGYEEVVSYDRGFCGLRQDRTVVCWPGGGQWSDDEILVFEGEFSDIAGTRSGVCALDLEGRMHCVNAVGKLKRGEVRRNTAVVINKGPFQALRGLRMGHYVCGVGNRVLTRCTSPKPYGGVNDWVTVRLSAAFRDAIVGSGGGCGIDFEDHAQCRVATELQIKPEGQYRAFADRKFERFATSYGNACAADFQDRWVCMDDVETTTIPLRDAVIVSGGSGLELQGIDRDGTWQTPAGPLSEVRHGFIEIQSVPGAICGLRRDATVHCRSGLLYDDDRLQNVTTLTSGDTFIETNHGRIGRVRGSPSQAHKGDGDIYGKDDPRNATIQGYVDVQHGNDFGCGLKSNGRAACWGRILGHPVVKPPTAIFEKIALTGHNACGITQEAGELICWGTERDPFGPMLPSGGGFVELATSYRSLCARREDDTVLCWGGFAVYEHPFRLPFQTKEFALTDSGVCGLVAESARVRCFGTGYRW